MNPQVMTERFEMRLSPGDMEELDAWRGRQEDLPSRSEAVRRLMEIGLAGGEKRLPLKLSDGEKLILMMLCDMYKARKLKGDMEPDFIENVIVGGHFWALQWKYTGIFHGHEDSVTILREVADIMTMWTLIERGYHSLSKADKDRVAVEAEPFGEEPTFPGFDGNEESEHCGITRFLIEELDRFSNFKGRNLSAGVSTIQAHRRMRAVFESIRNTPGKAGRDLNADELIAVLRAMLHPSRRAERT